MNYRTAVLIAALFASASGCTGLLGYDDPSFSQDHSTYSPLFDAGTITKLTEERPTDSLDAGGDSADAGSDASIPDAGSADAPSDVSMVTDTSTVSDTSTPETSTPEASVDGGADASGSQDASADAWDGSLPSHCWDGVRNFSESDVDCGWGCTLCAVGRSCNSGADCVTGKCSADGGGGLCQ